MTTLTSWDEIIASGAKSDGSIVEDLRDFVENVSARDRPGLAVFRKSRVRTTYVEWLTDTLPARASNAWIEGVDFTDQDLTAPSRNYAHVQTFARFGKVSDTQRAVEHAGFADQYLYQERKAVEATLNDIEHAIHRGSAITGTTDSARSFDGLINAISTNNTQITGVTFTEEVYNNLIQLFVDGGTEVFPEVTFVGSYLKRTISLFSTKVTRNVEASARVQELVVEQHKSDFGDNKIFYSRDQITGTDFTGSTNSVTIVDPDFFETGWLQPLMSETISRVGLSTRFQVTAMLTLIYRTELAGVVGYDAIPYILGVT